VVERWVINASPIILLAKAEVIHFLPQVCDQLIIPAGTVEEVYRGKMGDAGRVWLEREGKKFVVDPALNKFKAAGSYFSESLIQQALELANEI
jgi:predicted nucleic acid-binding protein